MSDSLTFRLLRCIKASARTLNFTRAAEQTFVAQSSLSYQIGKLEDNIDVAIFSKLGEFAATLKKGAHIQVEGELRSRKYDSKKTNSEQTVREIRVNSILKLDRAAKAAAEDDEDVTEEEAA